MGFNRDFISAPGYEWYDGSGPATSTDSAETMRHSAHPHGWSRSVGDLRIGYVGALQHGGRARIWVVGYFDEDRSQECVLGTGDRQTELYALAWLMIRFHLQAKRRQAKAYLRDLYRRVSGRSPR